MYTITQGTLAANANYSLSFSGAKLSITPAALAVTTDPHTRVYGASNPTFTVSYSGFVRGDTVPSLGGTLAFDTAATTAGAVGSYDIMPKGLTSSNYAITFVKGTLAVTPASLTVTTNPATKVYGSANPGFGVSYSGFLNGDDTTNLGGTLSFSTKADASSPVGTYIVTPSGLTSSNYTLTSPPAG